MDLREGGGKVRKRRTLIFCLGLLLALLVFPVSTLGAEGGAREHGERATQAGFVNGETVPSTSDTTKKSNDKKETLVEKTAGRFPNTGEKIAAGISGIGVLILLAGLIVYKINIKKVGKKR